MIIRYDDGSHRLTAACLIDFMTTPTEGAHSLARLHASAVAGIVLHGARTNRYCNRGDRTISGATYI